MRTELELTNGGENCDGEEEGFGEAPAVLPPLGAVVTVVTGVREDEGLERVQVLPDRIPKLVLRVVVAVLVSRVVPECGAEVGDGLVDLLRLLHLQLSHELFLGRLDPHEEVGPWADGRREEEKKD